MKISDKVYQINRMLNDNIDQWLIYNLQVHGLTIDDLERFNLHIERDKIYKLYLDGVKISEMEITHEIHA